MGSPGKAVAHGRAKCYPDKGAVRQLEKSRNRKGRNRSQSRIRIEEEDRCVIILTNICYYPKIWLVTSFVVLAEKAMCLSS